MEKIEQTQYYHIYNRGINGEVIFRDEENKSYFLTLAQRHLDSKVSILSYCLLKNHFHFIVEIVSEDKVASQALSNFFNAYSKAFNKKYNRTGSLFEKNFKRKQIKDEDYLRSLIIYIHTNPVHHGLTENYKQYNYSSFKTLVYGDESNLNINSAYIISLFDTTENMEFIHDQKKDSIMEKIEEFTPVRNLPGFENLEGFKAKEEFANYIINLQNTITSTLEALDGGAAFKEDIWDREEGGGGQTRVIENGNVFDKGGVNRSEVFGKLPDSMQQYFGVKDADFYACGLSLVLHPVNPMVPTVHANWRYFEMYDDQGNIVDQWFGGGQDLTPHYLFEEDAKHFHQICKTACDAHDPNFYPKYKTQCDKYFYNTHRQEGRGIGGLFFDYLKATPQRTLLNWYDFVTQVGDSFLAAYTPIVEKRKDMSYSEAHKNWQEIRRGRYVEFNLIHDKGTLFGLKTNGRIESILMSLPPKVQWKYNHQPDLGSEEEKLIEVLKNPKNWI
jgi:coproporphyrinogen III oxidase